jgi:acyl dehydratase
MSEAATIQVGDEIVATEFGPLTIVDTVRWAGVQENSERTHWDREFVRENMRLRTFIASGGYRQALLARALTDWLGPRGRLRKMQVRHLGPTFEGDMLRYSVKVTGMTPEGDWTAVACDFEGKNQKDEQVMVGTCLFRLA